jgi:hypothetical protein
MGAEAASWLSQAAGLMAAQLELLAPYAYIVVGFVADGG